MICPFQDLTDGSHCMVLRIAGELPPLCREGGPDDPGDKGYRRCVHYWAAIGGGLYRILRKERAGSSAGASLLTGCRSTDAAGAPADDAMNAQSDTTP